MKTTANNSKNGNSLKVKTHLKAGGNLAGGNHNQTLVRPQPKRSLKVRTSIKAGIGLRPH